MNPHLPRENRFREKTDSKFFSVFPGIARALFSFSAASSSREYFHRRYQLHAISPADFSSTDDNRFEVHRTAITFMACRAKHRRCFAGSIAYVRCTCSCARSEDTPASPIRNHRKHQQHQKLVNGQAVVVTTKQ